VKHWKAETELTELPPRTAERPRLRPLGGLERWVRVDSFEAPKPPRRQSELSGAVVGLALVATACFGVCLTLYQVTGPRDRFVDVEGPID
jgi:hypothetical protein